MYSMSPIMHDRCANKEMLAYNCGNAGGLIGEPRLSSLKVSYHTLIRTSLPSY